MAEPVALLLPPQIKSLYMHIAGLTGAANILLYMYQSQIKSQATTARDCRKVHFLFLEAGMEMPHSSTWAGTQEPNMMLNVGLEEQWLSQLVSQPL